MADQQLKINWKQHQRAAIIENAMIRDGKTDDGKTVKADKIKSLLLKVNSYLALDVDPFSHASCGNEVEAWPSQETLAKSMSVSVKTIERATEAAQNMCLLITKIKAIAGRGNTVGTHYRIVWSELLLLDQDRKRAFMESIAGERRERSDMEPSRSDTVTERSDTVTERSDILSERSDIVSAEVTTNYPKNHSPLLQSDPTRLSGEQPRTEDPWKVVVSELISGVRLGVKMAKAQEAVTAARSRELTRDQVDELIRRWERLRARQQGVTVGWLYRWLMGLSLPPDEPGEQMARKPSSSLMAESTRPVLDDIKRRKELQKAGIWDLEKQDAILASEALRVPPSRAPSAIGNVFQRPPAAPSQAEIERRRAGYAHAITNP
jgi:hypothetical protein